MSSPVADREKVSPPDAIRRKSCSGCLASASSQAMAENTAGGVHAPRVKILSRNQQIKGLQRCERFGFLSC